MSQFDEEPEQITGAALENQVATYQLEALERRPVPRENTARSLSFWLVITFSLSVGVYVVVSAVLAIYVTLTSATDLEATLGSLGKWAATMSTLLAAPLGFVLGHYFKSDAQKDEKLK